MYTHFITLDDFREVKFEAYSHVHENARPNMTHFEGGSSSDL